MSPAAPDGPPHITVFREEVVQALLPGGEGWYLDGTLGAGGHSEALLGAIPGSRVLGLDRDPVALELAGQRLAPFGERFRSEQADFREAPQLTAELGIVGLRGIVLDLGVSSMQFDTPERGFSFQHDAPLDMRFNSEQGPSAADLLRILPEARLLQVFSEYGQVRFARTLARVLVEQRRRQPLRTTREFADLCWHVAPRALKGHGRIHPATLPFQALRIAVNTELEGLEEAVVALAGLLGVGGRMAVISFHSLEDKAVKNAFRGLSKDLRGERRYTVLTPKPVEPSEAEVQANPRSRSAKLRVLGVD